MNRLFIGFLTVFFSVTAIAQNLVERLGVNENLEFNNTTYKLSWTAKPNDNYIIQEYLPEGESLDHFNQMMTIHLFLTDIKCKDAVYKKVNELITRKKYDSTCNYQVNESVDGKEFLIDFLLGENKDNKMTIVEFNVYRYKQIQISSKQNAIIVYAYTKRGYGNDITTFFETLENEKINYLKRMFSTKIPTVTIENKQNDPC
jgi:hypothetical protein